MKTETEMEMVRRHVREGEVHVKRQGALLAELVERGAPTGMATALHEQFKTVQRQHEEHLARLEASPELL